MVYTKSILVAAALTATVSVNAAGHHGGRPSRHTPHAPGHQGQRFGGAPHREGGPPHRQVQRIAREELAELDERSLLYQIPIIDHGPVMFPEYLPRGADEADLEAREPMIPIPPWNRERFPVDHNRDHKFMPHLPARPILVARDREHDILQYSSPVQFGIEARGGKKSGKKYHGKKRPHGHGRPKQHRPHGPKAHKRPQMKPHNKAPKTPKAPKMPLPPPPPTPLTPGGPDTAPGVPTVPGQGGSPGPVKGVPPTPSGAPEVTEGAPPSAPQLSQDLKTRKISGDRHPWPAARPHYRAFRQPLHPGPPIVARSTDEEDIEVRDVKKANPQRHGKKGPHGRPKQHRPHPPNHRRPNGPKQQGRKRPNGPKKPTIFPPTLPTPPIMTQPGKPGPVVDAPPSTEGAPAAPPAESGAIGGAPQTLKARLVLPPWYHHEGGRPFGGPFHPPKPANTFRRNYKLNELD